MPICWSSLWDERQIDWEGKALKETQNLRVKLKFL